MSFSINNHLFLKSARAQKGAFLSTEEAIDWIKKQNEAIDVSVKKIPFSQLDQWYFNDKKEILKHASGRFFTIEGLRINANKNLQESWDQPIMNQSEIGFIGFIAQEFDGILHFLLQAKVEPGNTNHVQLSPTLQATKSNYTRVHQGKAPDYLTYFTDVKPSQILVDQLQSEQGARFLRKRNRNIIIKVDHKIEVKEHFIWLTLGQIKTLMQLDNFINMDSRTVLSCIPYLKAHQQNELAPKETVQNPMLSSMFYHPEAVHTFEELLAFSTAQKVHTDLWVEKIPLTEMREWEIDENSIHHKKNKHFNIIATEVNISSREVISWSQPMVEPVEKGICAFIAKMIHGVLHLAVQCKMECGNFDKVEFAPTVQCLPSNYKNSEGQYTLPFLEEVLNAKPQQIIFDTYQSEEGGRFFYEQNRNMLIWGDENFPEELPESYVWMTLHQLNTFIKFNNYVNIQARTLLAAIPF